MSEKDSAKTNEITGSDAAPKTCGLIMPITDMEPYPEGHWSDVKTIIEDAVKLIPDVTFNTRLVSESDASHFIHKTIVQQVYSDDIIVCDLSGHNPNVFLELGMRLAFARPVVLIVDDRYRTVFDVSIIEYIMYPNDLHHRRIEEFKQKLAKKVAATYQQSLDEPDRKFFVEHFDITQIAELDTNRVSQDQAVLRSLAEIQADISKLKNRKPNIALLKTDETDWSSLDSLISSKRAKYNILDPRHRNSLQLINLPDNTFSIRTTDNDSKEESPTISQELTQEKDSED